MVKYSNEKMFIEFERTRKLASHLHFKFVIEVNFSDVPLYRNYLPNTVDKLKKHRWSISIWMSIVPVSNSLRKFVSKTEPLFFYDHLESPQSTVVWVKQ